VRAFITGAAGFAGSHLGEHLLACCDVVLGCSRRGDWPADFPSDVAADIELFRWDLADGLTDAVARRVSDFAPDAIFHLAALSVPADCGEQEPSPAAIAANVDGTRSLLQLAASLPAAPRLLFASSCYVYASVSPSSPVVSEDAPIAPRGGYGKSKWAAEQAVVEAAQRTGLPVVIARAFQHSGPRQSPRMILPDWARQFASDDDPIRAVCLDTYLDLTDVRDIVRAYRELVRTGGAGVYNLGTGVARRSGDLLAELQQLSGSQRAVVEQSPGLRQHPIADIRRLVSQTGWQPRIPLRQTLRDILDYWIQRKET